MVMGEELLMLKCELDHLLCGISKPKDQKKISFMIQMHNGKKC
jgi:hypothetical protein